VSFRAAWITGASTGIGRALALELASKGTRVAVSARSADGLAALAGHADNIMSVPLDVTDRNAVAQAADIIEAAFGDLDLCVPNAGISQAWSATAPDADAFERLFDVNVTGVVNTLAAVVPRFVDRGRGQISVMSSVAGFRGLPTAAAYCSSKAAVTVLCESMKLDLDQAGVKMQVIHPGFVETPLTDKNPFRMPFLMSPEEAAKRICQGLARDRFEITFPRRFTWWLKLMRCLPYGMYFPVVRRFTGLRG
jgi:NADP-dependent 3-hydroxy acid dehydrogenase YdfG